MKTHKAIKQSISTLVLLQLSIVNAVRLRPLTTRACATTFCTKSIIPKIGRGGGDGSYIQSNPNYDRYLPPTLDDMENNHIQRPQQQYNDPYASYSVQQPPKPISQAIQEFAQQLYATSPTLFYGTASSLAVFILWQIPPLSAILRSHFICSQYNLRHKRYHTLLTSMISHNSLSHVAMNLFGFFTFGKSVEPILARNDVSFSAYCLLAGIVANFFFLTIHPQGSCIGLSGVVLSLLALDARLHPSKEIGFVVRFIPVRLPAQYALTGLLVWSVVGIMATLYGKGGGDGIAHATHLAGILFGLGTYELLHRGIWRKIVRKWKRLRKAGEKQSYVGKPHF